MRDLLGYVVLAFVLFWVVSDPTGAANTVAYVAHALGVAAGSLAHYLSPGKPALPGVSAHFDQRQGQP